MKTEKLRADLEKAREKAAMWQARAKDIEKKLTEQENLEIIQAVRSITASPEELRELLMAIQSMREMPAGNIIEKKEETGEHDENETENDSSGASA